MMLDMEATAVDTSALKAWVGFRPDRPLELGLERFADWICRYPQFAGMAA
jgi:UDP-glucuronate 4-epimerase